MKHYDIITIGAATRDIFMSSDAFTVMDDPTSPSGKEQCLNLGSKIDIEHIIYATGGGATNAAATFAAAGLKTAFVGRVGCDEDAESVMRDLRHYGIDTRFVVQDPKHRTGMSVILSASSLDRTVLVHRGASEALTVRDLPFASAKSNWVYMSSLAGNFQIFNAVAKSCKQHKGLIAWNPGGQELNQKEKLRKALKQLAILILNTEEANDLLGTHMRSMHELAKSMRAVTRGIVVLTDGDRGAMALAGNELFFCEPKRSVRVVERTGAGDAFGSGFLAGLLKSRGNITSALQYAAANAESVIGSVGAKDGVLSNTPTRSLHAVRRLAL